MANTISIKRRWTGAATAPAALKSGELAYNGLSDTLYIGFGDDGNGNATSVKSIAGSGVIMMLTGAQTVAGVKTFSLSPIVPTPTADTEAANKAYVDTVAQGLDAKGSVKAATTVNITLSAAQTIDGVALVAGDRVLVKNQTTASANGLYVVATGAWTRATDANLWVELPGAFTFVEQGTTNAASGWVCTVSQGGTLETTAVTWAQFSGAGQITAGNGLSITGNTINAVGTANRITVGASAIDIAATYVGQTSITTLGTIATGTWNATAIGVTKGGLGLTAAVNGLLKGNGSTYSVAVAGADYLSPSDVIDGGTF